jgi:hypothetical protein
VGRGQIPHAALLEFVKEVPESTGDKEKRDGTLDRTTEAEVLCSYDAEEVEKNARGVRGGGNIWARFRLAALNWCGNSFRLRLMGLADNS